MTTRKARTKAPSDDLSLAMGRALRRAARRAREIARMHGTPIYVLKDGKIVAMKAVTTGSIRQKPEPGSNCDAHPDAITTVRRIGNMTALTVVDAATQRQAQLL